MPGFNLINPANSDVQFQTMIFPDGQPHLKIDMQTLQSIDRKEKLTISSRMNNAADLLLIMLAKNTLDYLEFESIELYISYLLAARMDRVMLEGEPFSLKVIASILNGAGFKKVKIFDPHSEVSTALIDRSYSIPNHRFVQDALDDYFQRNEKKDFCLVSPDAGALKKIHKLAQWVGVENVVECMKERDLKTGALTHFNTATADLTGLTCFIVDDICDGGGTFAGTAKMLKEKGAIKVVLIVSHGIFSKGTTIEFVDEIYSTDSYKLLTGIHCFPIEKYLV